MPLAVRLWGRWSGKGPEFMKGSYYLRAGTFLNIVGLLYLAFACITFNFPSSYPITASNMNYTCAAVGVSVLIATVTWFTTGRKGFTGPQAGGMLDGGVINAQHIHHASSSIDRDYDVTVVNHNIADPVIDNKRHAE